MSLENPHLLRLPITLRLLQYQLCEQQNAFAVAPSGEETFPSNLFKLMRKEGFEEGRRTTKL